MKIKHVSKKYEVTGNLNNNLSDLIFDNIKSVVEMRTKVIYSFSCDIFQAKNEVIRYHKTMSNNKTFTSLREIENYIKECELRRLDLDNVEVWSKAYLPATRIVDDPNVYEGRVMFLKVHIKLISSKEPLMGCGPLPDWLKSKKCLYGIDNYKDNLCVWRCLAIFKRIKRKQNRPEVNTTKEALNLAREFYEQTDLKVKDVRATKLVDFERI